MLAAEVLGVGEENVSFVRLRCEKGGVRMGLTYSADDVFVVS